MGAVCAVLNGGKSERGAFVLSAAKNAHGHAEASAGMVGTLNAVTNLCHSNTHLLANLCTVNPYVAETLSVSIATLPPREKGGVARLNAEDTGRGGVSSFAFQGTNAHALLGVGDVDVMHVITSRTIFHRLVLWCSSQAHPMLEKSTTKPVCEI